MKVDPFEGEYRRLEAKLLCEFPKSYTEFLRKSHGTKIAVGSCFLDLWPLKEVAAQNTVLHQLDSGNKIVKVGKVNSDFFVICFEADRRSFGMQPAASNKAEEYMYLGNDLHAAISEMRSYEFSWETSKASAAGNGDNPIFSSSHSLDIDNAILSSDVSDEFEYPDYSLRTGDQDFTRIYLSSLDKNLSGFYSFFRIIAAFFALQSVAGFIVAIALLSTTLWGAILLLAYFFQTAICVWGAVLARDFVQLQVRKTKFETVRNAEFRTETVKMGKQVLEKVRRRAEKILNSVTVAGNNYGAILANVGDNNHVVQIVNAKESKEVAEAIALMLAYCEEEGNPNAIQISKTIAKEAENANPEKSILFQQWTTLISILPGIADVVKIAQGLRTLMGF